MTYSKLSILKFIYLLLAMLQLASPFLHAHTSNDSVNSQASGMHIHLVQHACHEPQCGTDSAPPHFYSWSATERSISMPDGLKQKLHATGVLALLFLAYWLGLIPPQVKIALRPLFTVSTFLSTRRHPPRAPPHSHSHG
ncbi:MAG: hypothetical protein ORN21_07170 [Methylophilaceae bacterium]|nr:hypothetical protein [Methylophilaceae bacterium]